MGDFIDNAIVAGSIALYLLGRICDDMTWYAWSGISSDQFEAIGIIGLACSAVLITIVRLRSENGWKVLFVQSQLRFIIPWALVVLQCTLIFHIFGCYSDDTTLQGQDMDRAGCGEYCTALILTNYIYSALCSSRGQIPFFLTTMIVMFAEIIYSGKLLVHFVSQLQQHPKSKDKSILFVSIMIAWLVLVMDLNFRAVYEEPHHLHKVHKIHHKIHYHNNSCRHHRHEEGNNSDMRLRTQQNEVMSEGQRPFTIHQTRGSVSVISAF